MSRKRSSLQIHLDVLRAINHGTEKPTRIMNRSNISWKPLMKIINSMLQQKLIEKENKSSHSIYSITEKGKKVLIQFEDAFQQMEIE